MPVGACHAATLAFGNAVYLHLSVAFIQMLKAFTPVIVLVVVVAAGMERPTRQYVACMCVLIELRGTRNTLRKGVWRRDVVRVMHSCDCGDDESHGDVVYVPRQVRLFSSMSLRAHFATGAHSLHNNTYLFVRHPLPRIVPTEWCCLCW